MSDGLKERAERVMPGGVNSPVRAFRSVGGEPIHAREARRATLTTTDGRTLTDFCMSFGPLILGHAHPAVTSAIAAAAGRGTSFAVTTEAEIEMAETLCRAIPAVQKVRLVSSGTEACMTAVRLARGFTGRNKVLKFSGCYHGHVDSLLVRAGSGAAGLAAATSAGIPASFAEHTLVARYNRTDDVAQLVGEYGKDLAAIVVEPVAANVGLLLPKPGFLAALRELSRRCGALLVFDEVITGFRWTYGSYSSVCGVTPDLVCLGKIIGGGLPVGAVGGRAEIMDCLAPLGPVYQAGTLSGNPVAVAAGLAALRELDAQRPYEALAQRTAVFADAIAALATEAGFRMCIPHDASVFSLFFMDRAPESFEDIPADHAAKFRRMFHALLKEGVYLPPSPYEVSFLSTAHTEGLLASALVAWKKAFAEMASERA